MSIASLTNLLNCAKTRNNYVVGFVVQGWEDASSFVRAADETETDIILQSGPGLRKNMPLELIYAMFEKLSGETNIKIVPHLDHGENYDICKKALDIGFTSIMYDGSKLSFKENLNQSLKIYELTQKYNACLEVELGFVGYNDISKNKKTSPEEVKLFTDELPVTAMAVSVGNTHLQNENSAIEFHHYLYKYLNSDMGKITALEYFGYNCQAYMKNKEFLFRNKNEVGVYIQVPIFNGSIDNEIDIWANIFHSFDNSIDLDSIIILNEPSNWKMFFEARHSMPDEALTKTKSLGGISIITDTIVPPINFKKYS